MYKSQYAPNTTTSLMVRSTNEAMTKSGIHRTAYQSFYPASKIDLESAKLVARKLFQTYDTGNAGEIDSKGARCMISDSYYSINKNYVPSDTDVHDYLKCHDRDHDGRVTLGDLERCAIQYLSGIGGTGLNLSKHEYLQDKPAQVSRNTMAFSSYKPANPIIESNIESSTVTYQKKIDL